MTSRRTSPTVRRRRLASEMRKLRKEARKSLEEAAKFADIGRATVARIEAATHAPRVNDIRALCKLYGVNEERTEALAELARQSRLRGWWQRFSGTIPDWFAFYVGLEEEVSDLRTYHPELVLGLLQTEAYIRAVMLSGITVPSDEELDQRVSVRLKRQERITGPGAIKLWSVIHEGALRSEVGGRAVMREQLLHLIKLSRMNNITVQILPFSAGSHPGNDGPFEILSFPEPEDSDIVYLQNRQGSLYLEDPADVAAYTEVFDHLRARALSPDESRFLIQRIADGMT